MTVYRFLITEHAITPYRTHNRKAAAENREAAIADFCRRGKFTLLEDDGEDIWVEDAHGAMIRYSVWC